MGILERIGRMFGSTTAGHAPQAAFFQSEKNPLMVSFNPQLRETQADVQASWEKAAARAVHSIQNSGFIAGVVEISSGAVVGTGLRMAARPDAESLGWDRHFATQWSRKVESRFRAWAGNPRECDAAGQMTFGQMQQAAYVSYMRFGEIVALMPLLRRPGTQSLTRVALVPPLRLMNYNDSLGNWVQGVKIDGWGLPSAYKFREKGPDGFARERVVAAQDASGRLNVLHFKDPEIGVTRGISPFAPVLKVVRQVDQYADATLTSALIQTIFAATLKTNLQGLSAFEGLMTDGDTGALKLGEFLGAKGDFYDGAKIDLTQHGRIAQLFPNDELIFNEAKQPGQEYDQFMGWLLREIARGAGVTYEAATGDYRGATYSSVRMASAIEWLTVLRRRTNLIEPFCKTVYEAWLEEEIHTGRIEFPGGIEKFKLVKALASRATWNGPVKPQADDFKTARAYEVRKDMQATTLAEIAEEYGRDWDDDMRQRANENALADELDLPRPWAISDILEKPDGEDLALEDPGNDGSGERQDSKPRPKQAPGRKRKSGGRDPAEREPADALNAALETELEASISEAA